MEIEKKPKRENFSRKRMLILKTLQGCEHHPTADWIYDQLKPNYPNLSLGTVYRNLKQFCETGKAVSVGVINGQEHFDADVSPHSHMVCDDCAVVLDIYKDFFDEDALDKVSDETGMELYSASVLFRGLCPSCSKKRDLEDEQCS